MKLPKQLLIALLLAAAVFCAILYTSCTKKREAGPCDGVVCLNGGVCDTAATCKCPTGYEGAYCENQARKKFLKTWKASDTMGKALYIYNVTLTPSTTDSSAVIIGTAFSNNYFKHGVFATTDGNTITIPLQYPDSNQNSVTGWGTLWYDGRLYLLYTRQDANGGYFDAVWQ